MMSVDSKNVYGNPGLQRPNFTLKMSYLRVKFGLCNLGFPYTFLESTDIIQHCYVFGFLGTYQPLLALSEVQTPRGLYETTNADSIILYAFHNSYNCANISHFAMAYIPFPQSDRRRHCLIKTSSCFSSCAVIVSPCLLEI